MAFLLAGGERPERQAPGKQWNIHHIARAGAFRGRRSGRRSSLFRLAAQAILCLGFQTMALVIAESHPPIANLFSKNAVRFDELFDDVLLMLGHPASDGDDQK